MEIVGQEGLRGSFQLLLSNHGSKSAYNISPESNYGLHCRCFCLGSTDGVMKSLKRCDYASSAEPEFD